MIYQRRVFPSTSMLLAFDAAARAGSFTAAARELRLTQGAVSRQISALEQQLDVVVFDRGRKAIELTEVGRTYFEEIHEALQIIRRASLNAMTSPLNATLNLAIHPTFGTRWLMPRFPHFLQENPNVTVHFSSKVSFSNFKDEDLHSAILYGSPDWDDAESHYLMGEEVIPVCSPQMLPAKATHLPEALLKVPLLHLESRPNAWRDWFSMHNLVPPEEQGMLFEQFSIIAQAAVAGVGAALLPTFLIQGELDRTELVAISRTPLVSKSGYYLVTPRDRLRFPPANAFCEWLLNTIEAERGS